MNDCSEPESPNASAAALTRSGRVTGIGLTAAVRAQATGYVERRKDEIVHFLAEIARALHNGNGRTEETSSITSQAKPFVDGVAGSLDAMSRSLDERDVGDLYRDVESVTRRHPEIGLAVVIATVFGAFHLLRSSPTTRGSNPDRLRP